MRILLIHSFYKPGLPSGENDVVLSQAELLVQAGLEVLVWGPSSPDEMAVADRIRTGLNVIRGGGADPTRAIADFQPDVIHVHNLFPNISTRWMHEVSTPLVMSIHNYRTVCANGTLIRESKPCTACVSGSSFPAIQHGCYMASRIATVPVVRFQKHLRVAIDKCVDKLIYTSELSRKVLSAQLNPRSSVVIPNFVADVGIGTDTIARDVDEYFIVLGRLSPEKGVAGLLRIWPSGKRLVIVGDGPQRVELEEISDRGWVEFTGFVDSAARDSLLRGAQAMILPSVTPEADPVVVAQALSAGTPVIALKHTATATLASSSASVQSYSDASSLRASIENLNPAAREAARHLYDRTWSESSWLRSYLSLCSALFA